MYTYLVFCTYTYSNEKYANFQIQLNFLYLKLIITSSVLYWGTDIC